MIPGAADHDAPGNRREGLARLDMLAVAGAICEHLDLELGRVEVGTFADGETSVDIGENVRGMDVFVIQSTCAPANTNLMELLILLDALRRSQDEATSYLGDLQRVAAEFENYRKRALRERDEIVPFDMGETLFREAASPGKAFHAIRIAEQEAQDEMP